MRPSLRNLRPKRALEESSDSMSDSPHGKRQRNRKNDKQVEVLKAKFDFNRLWTKKEIKALAEETGLSQSQVYKWRWDYRKKLQAEVLEEMSVRSFVTEEVLLPSQTDWELYELQRGYKKSTGKEEVMYAAGLSYALGSDFYYGTNKVLLDDIARNPVLLLYFTASWCPASQQFNEVLFQTYQQINSSRKTLEVIVVSKERNEIDYRRYTDRMPCILVPYDPDRVQELFRKYQINEVPQLVLLKKDDGGILTREGKLHIEADGAAVIERWKKMFYGIIV